jgi:hypothetical protein
LMWPSQKWIARVLILPQASFCSCDIAKCSADQFDTMVFFNPVKEKIYAFNNSLSKDDVICWSVWFPSEKQLVFLYHFGVHCNSYSRQSSNIQCIMLLANLRASSTVSFANQGRGQFWHISSTRCLWSFVSVLSAFFSQHSKTELMSLALKVGTSIKTDLRRNFWKSGIRMRKRKIKMLDLLGTEWFILHQYHLI